jgi:hypothetical protein
LTGTEDGGLQIVADPACYWLYYLNNAWKNFMYQCLYLFYWYKLTFLLKFKDLKNHYSIIN